MCASDDEDDTNPYGRTWRRCCKCQLWRCPPVEAPPHEPDQGYEYLRQERSATCIEAHSVLLSDDARSRLLLHRHPARAILPGACSEFVSMVLRRLDHVVCNACEFERARKPRVAVWRWIAVKVDRSCRVFGSRALRRLIFAPSTVAVGFSFGPTQHSRALQTSR